jgi:hypothetical protein
VTMNRIQSFFTAMVVIVGLFVLGGDAVAAPSAKHHNHHDGKALLGDNLKHDGHHDIDHKGKYTTSVEVKNGKIAAVHVKHTTKGDISVKKYKTHKKMAQAVRGHLVYASLVLAQMEDMGTVYIGYAYIDDDGNEEIYWFPYDEILDGDTGAVEYVAES